MEDLKRSVYDGSDLFEENSDAPQTRLDPEQEHRYLSSPVFSKKNGGKSDAKGKRKPGE